MATTKVSALSALTAPDGAEELLINDGGTSKKITITNVSKLNLKGGDLTSASPLVIDTDGNYFDVTGTTNFSAMTVAANRQFTLQFDGALTMTHHATNLDLPSEANITTAAGDVATFQSTGANTVQCINYTKADGTSVVAAGYTLPEATASTKGGIELFSDTDQSVAAESVSTTASRTYGLQLNSAGQGVVNVPWVDTNTTYSAGAILTLIEDGVDSVHYKDASIDNEHLADNAVDTAEIADDAVTADKLANSINTEISANTAKVTNATHTGDVTGATSLTIANDAVTYAKMQNVSADERILGRVSGADGVIEELTKAQVLTFANVEDGADVTDATNVTAAGALMDSEVTNLAAVKSFAAGDYATAAQGTLATNALPKAGGTMTGAVVGATDTDTSNSGTVDLDFTADTNFVLTLTGNITSLTASNEVAGQSGFIVFIQDGTGSRTVALHGDYETAGGAGLTLTSTASATDIVPYVVAASSRILLGTPQLAFA